MSYTLQPPAPGGSAAPRGVTVTPGMPASALVLPAQDSADSFDYTFNFGAWLVADDNRIASVAGSSSPDPALALAAPTTDAAGIIVRMRISGGTANTIARIGLALTLSDGEVVQFVFRLPIYARAAGLVPIGSSVPPPGAVADSNGPVIDAAGFLIAA